MHLIVFVGKSLDASITVDQPSGAVQLALSNHGRIIGRAINGIVSDKIIIICLEICALIDNLTTGSAVEGLKEVQVKWLEFTPVL